MLPPDAILGSKSKCTQNAFAAAGGAYSAPPDPLAVFEGAASQQGRGGDGKGGKGRGGEGKGEGRGRKGGKGNGPSQL